MKKYKSYIILTLIFAGILYACSTDNKSEIQENELNISNFNKVGEIHNQGLDAILNDKTFNDIENIVNPNGQLRSNNVIDTLAIAQLIFNETNSFIARNPTIVMDGQTINIPQLSSFDEFMDTYRNQILEYYDLPDENSPDGTITSIENKMLELSLNNLQDEYYSKMSTGSVYKHSVEYWSDPNNPLNEYISEEGLQNRGWFNWVSLAMSDASGAWSGAQLGAVTGPAGAIGGAVAFGLCHSALNAAVQAAVHKARN